MKILYISTPTFFDTRLHHSKVVMIIYNVAKTEVIVEDLGVLEMLLFGATINSLARFFSLLYKASAC